MSESVEQAARVAGWRARAEREAAALLAETGDWPLRNWNLVVATAWLQGASFGMHAALDEVNDAFEEMCAEALREPCI